MATIITAMKTIIMKTIIGITVRKSVTRINELVTVIDKKILAWMNAPVTVTV